MGSVRRRIAGAGALALSTALVALIAGSAFAQSASDGIANPAPSQTDASQPADADRFAGRPDARIAFARQIRDWRIKTENGDDVLYVEGPNRQWFRGVLLCRTGSSDARWAKSMVPLTTGTGFDRTSRVQLLESPDGRQSSGTTCSLQSFVALTEEEAFEFELRRRPRQSQAAQPGNSTNRSRAKRLAPTVRAA